MRRSITWKSIMLILFLFSWGITLYAQQVSGTIYSDGGNSTLSGVTIHVLGSQNGSISDARGKYQISGVKATDSLIFSSVGYSNQSVLVGDKTTIDVKMSPIASDLDQVVVIGYGTAKRKDLTGSVSSVDLSKSPNGGGPNLMQRLVGMTSGLNIIQSGGASGGTNFSIRGQHSLSGSTQPLLVVDGVIYPGSIDDIDPNNIESVDVLKGASAAAIYGRRSANGVLIINTKKGIKGKPTITLDVNGGFQEMTNNKVQFMDGDQFAIRLLDWNWMQDVYKWYDTHPVSSEGRPERPDVNDRSVVSQFLRTPSETQNYLDEKETDWVNSVLRKGSIQNYNLGIRGGSDNSKYYLSSSYSDQQGILKNDEFKRVSVHADLNNKITSWLETDLNSTYTRRDNSGLPASLTSAEVASPLELNVPKGEEGYKIYLGDELFQPYPFVDTYVNNSNVTTNLFTIGSLIIKIPWIKGLRYTLRYSRSDINTNNFSYYNNFTTSGSTNNGQAVKNYSKETDWIIDNIINYDYSFGKHNISATALLSREKREGEGSILQATNFGIDILGYNNIGLGLFPTVSSSAFRENSISYMGRVNYSYLSRYLLTATIRRDGYSGFSLNHKWANFPSLGLGWIISEENFFNNKDIFLKIRGSYGLNGNQGVGRYASFSRVGNEDYVYGSNTALGIYPTQLGNNDLTWETTKSFNFGVDFTVVQSRLNGSVDVYSSRTSNVLVQRQIPQMSGYISVWSNLSKIKNSGINANLNSINLNGAISWKSNLTFSLDRDKIASLYGKGGDKDPGNAWFVGEPISAIYDYKIIGVWQENDLFNGDIYPNRYPGDFIYEDVNHDGDIEPADDRLIVGYEAPNYRFSLGNEVSFKSFTLSLLINSIQGGRKYFLADNLKMTNPDFEFPFRKNMPAVNYWTPLNPTNKVMGISNRMTQRAGYYQSRSFVRIQNISLNYNIPKSLLDKFVISNASVYISSRNPYVFTKWDGWDPESGTSDIPLMRDFIIGLKCSF